MLRTILRQQLPQHPKLGRNINLDSKSWAYAVRAQDVAIRSVRHESHIALLNQGNIGSCTGNAAVACAYRVPFHSPGGPQWPFSPDENGALDWYRRNTQLDPFPGTYEPDDTGSDGLTASKVAVEAGIISGYRMSGDLQSSLEALMDRPGITGLPWYASMFDASAKGLLHVDRSSGLQGGHELCVDEIVAADAKDNGTGKVLVGGPNSWGTSWGDWGRWYLTADDWWSLRQEGGDVYFWEAKSQPAPTPAPADEPSWDEEDLDLWNQTAAFRAARHTGSPQAVSKALTTWGAQKGFH